MMLYGRSDDLIELPCGEPAQTPCHRTLRVGGLFCLIIVSVANVNTASAGTTRDKAFTAVAVARAQVELANSRPQLPDTRESNSDSDPREAHDATNGMDATRVVPLAISFNRDASVSEVMPAQLVIKAWSSGCPHCVRQERDIRRILGSRGWTIGNAVTDQIRFVVVPQTEAVPQCVLYQRGNEVKKWEGYQDPAMLSIELRKAWDESPASRQRIATTGYAGSIQGKVQIRQLLEWFKTHIGEGIKAEVRWDRSGVQSFPLFAKGDWSAVALFGKFGHIKLSASGAANLPLESIGFSYTVEGDDVICDLDAITFQGLALKLGPNSRTPRSSMLAETAPAPSQIGLASVWTILSVMRDVWSLLHPTCDLELGGNISASAMLSGDLLEIEFQQMPSIRLVALFTFQLGVKQIKISDSNVHVEFNGSRLVRSRDFAVR